MPGQRVLVIDDSATIVKVVEQALAKEGYQVQAAADGEEGIELARENPPDLILLDFVLPKMNGYQVSSALGADKRLRDVPLVLMSTKSDQIGERLIRTMGVAATLTKPFPPEAIVEVVGETLAKYGKKKSASEAKPATSRLEKGRRACERAHSETVALLEQELGTTLAKALTEAGAGDHLVKAAQSAFVELDSLLGRAAEESPAALLPPQIGWAGWLAQVPLLDLLQILGEQLQSGILKLNQNGVQVDVFLNEGKVAFAQSRGLGPEFLLGRYVLERKLMSPQDLELHMQSRSDASGQRLGTQLVKLGYLTQAELTEVMSRQTKDLLFEALRWGEGGFAFQATHELPEVAQAAALALRIDAIVLEGKSRMDEWHLVELEVENYDVVFLRCEQALSRVGPGQLSRDELRLLDLIDGDTNVREILESSNLGSFDVVKLLARLHSLRLIRKRVAPVAV